MKVGVSDHALVRFLERAGGFDMEQLRGQMQTALERSGQVAGALGQKYYTVKADGLVFVVIDGVCVTVMRKGERSSYVVREEPRR
jgi:hypothetical protein